MEFTAGSEETLHLKVSLPDSKPFDVYLGSNVKVSCLLETALHNRKWFPVQDIQLRCEVSMQKDKLFL